MKKFFFSFLVGTALTLAGCTCTKQADKSASVEGLAKNMVIETQHGKIEIEFYPSDAPKTVARIQELVKSGFYNGLTFHRVIPGFVAQGGDPSGNGTGGSGTKLKAEFNSRKHVEGTVAMARAQDVDSADCQFYIALGTLPHLDNNYTVFGMVTKGMDAVKKIQVGDKMLSVTLQ
jgi:peptidylprolyl isomerase/peptidyl-prolyl cis-trans isomerase B (cyclophilin B)